MTYRPGQLENDYHYCPKYGTVWFYNDNAVMHPKDANGMDNSVNPDQSAPLCSPRGWLFQYKPNFEGPPI